MKAGLLALFLGACAHTPPTPEATPVQIRSALVLPDALGRSFDARSLDGRVVLVNFFATWCFPCVAEVPSLVALQRDHEAKGFTVVAVGMDLEGRKVIAPFARHYNLTFPVLLASDRILEGSSVFGPITALPSSYLLDRQGRVLVAFSGVASPKDMDRLVRKALER
jgi:thiol-disulfide isomerase/thioredoxin